MTKKKETPRELTESRMVVGSKNTMEQDQKHTLPAPLLVCTHSGTGAWSCLITGILHCLLYILRTDANRGCQLFSALLQLTSGARVSNRQPLRCGASLKAQRRAEPPEGRMLGVSSLQGSCMCTLAVYPSKTTGSPVVGSSSPLTGDPVRPDLQTNTISQITKFLQDHAIYN